MMVVRFIQSFFAVFVIAFLTSCGTETVTEGATEYDDAMIVMGGDTPLRDLTCGDEFTGRLAYAKNENLVYFCVGGKWALVSGIDGVDGENGTNGANGKDGHRGTNGTDGNDCKLVEFGNGYSLSCGGTSAAIYKNKTELPGCYLLFFGDSYLLDCDGILFSIDGYVDPKVPYCEHDRLDDDTVELVCGDYSEVTPVALCYETPYNPVEDKFCYDGVLYAKCNGKAYDVAKEKCTDNLGE